VGGVNGVIGISHSTYYREDVPPEPVYRTAHGRRHKKDRAN
jgi:hypothetical protein